MTQFNRDPTNSRNSSGKSEGSAIPDLTISPSFWTAVHRQPHLIRLDYINLVFKVNSVVSDQITLA